MHLSAGQIEVHIRLLRECPKNNGLLEYIVLRPSHGERLAPREAVASPRHGLVGDCWEREKNPDPEAQVSVINSRFLRALAGTEERMTLSGDNLVVDLDLAEENLPAGTVLEIGSAVFEVTAHPHRGCSLFTTRFGVDALEAVNSKIFEPMRLRGLFMKVIKEGMIHVNDEIRRITP